jgi:hypothetical protein
MVSRIYLELRSLLLGEAPYKRRKAPEPELITALIPIIPKDLLIRFQFATYNFNKKQRILFFMALTEYFPKTQLPELLRRLLSKLPELAINLSDETLDAALEATNDIAYYETYENRLAAILSFLAPRFLGKQQKQILEQALKVANSIEYEVDKVKVLTAIAKLLSKSEKDKLVNEVLSFARSFEPDSRAVTLTNVISLLDEKFRLNFIQEALSLMPNIESEDERADTLVELTKSLPENAQPIGLLQTSLNIAEAMKDPANKFMALAALIPQMPNPLANSTFETLLTSVKAALHDIPNVLIDYELKKAEDFLRKLQPGLCLSETHKTRILQVVLSTVSSLPQEETRAYILTELIPHFTSEMIPEALNNAQIFKENWWRIRVLSRLLSYLPETTKGEFADEVYAVSNEYLLKQIAELRETDKVYLLEEVVHKFLEEYGGTRKKGMRNPERTFTYSKPNFMKPLIPPKEVKPPFAPPEERVINTGFSSFIEADKPLSKMVQLEPNTQYYFWFEVGRFIDGNIEVKPTELKMELLPVQARLKVALFAFKDEIEIAPGFDAGEIQIQLNWTVRVARKVECPKTIPPNSDLLDRRLFFPVKTPGKEGEFRFRCNIYYEQNLIESRLVKVQVANNPKFLPIPSLQSTVEYSMSKMLETPYVSRLISQLRPQALSVMLNDNGDGTHCFRIIGADGLKSEKNFNALELRELIRFAREALCKASWGDKEPWSARKRSSDNYRYKGNIDQKRLKEDLVELAKQGHAFWAKFATETAGTRPEITKLSNLVRNPINIEFIIKKNSKAEKFMFPAALIYDYPLDTQLNSEKYTLCPSFLRDRDSEISLEKTDCFRGACPSRGTKTIVCPSGFWGFRHSIGFPLGTSSETNLEMTYKDTPEIIGAVFPSFSQWPAHKEGLESFDRKINWNLASTRNDTFAILKSPNPHLVYFYCHGGIGDGGSAYIMVGEKNEPGITPAEIIDDEEICWLQRQPLVFINGCETAAIGPEMMLSFVEAFVRVQNAAGVVGTEITVFESLARTFAEECLRRFLIEGETIGDAIRATRLKLLKQGNPLGLVYTTYANVSLRIKKSP